MGAVGSIMNFIRNNSLVRMLIYAYCLGLFIIFFYMVIWPLILVIIKLGAGLQNKKYGLSFLLTFFGIIFYILFFIALYFVGLFSGLFILLYMVWIIARGMGVHILLYMFFEPFRDGNDTGLFGLFDGIFGMFGSWSGLLGGFRSIFNFIRGFVTTLFGVAFPGYSLNQNAFDSTFFGGNSKDGSTFTILKDNMPLVKVNYTQPRKYNDLEMTKINNCIRENTVEISKDTMDSITRNAYKVYNNEGTKNCYKHFNDPEAAKNPYRYMIDNNYSSKDMFDSISAGLKEIQSKF